MVKHGHARGTGSAIRILIVCPLAASVLFASACVSYPAAAEGQVRGAGASEAIDYIKSRQNPDGGFSEPGESSDPTTTSWALLAGAALGEQPLTWKNSGADPAQYLTGMAGTIRDFKQIELIALAITKAGGDPRNAAGIDLVSLGKANISDGGKIGADISEHCWGILFLTAAGEPVPAKCTEWLVEQQRQDGGWGESNKVLIQDTALAIEALVAAGEPAQEILDAGLKLLKDKINSDGGFKGPSGKSDSQTTSGVVRAITVSGEDPASEEWSFQGNTPVSFLNSMQAEDGHFQYSKGKESQPTVTTAMAAIATKGVTDGQSSQDGGDQSQAATVDEGPSASGNLGTAGADMSRQGGTTSESEGGPALKATVLKGPSSGAQGSLTGATGFWMFLIICAIYLGLLILLVAVVGILVRRPSEPPLTRTPYV